MILPYGSAVLLTNPPRGVCVKKPSSLKRIKIHEDIGSRNPNNAQAWSPVTGTDGISSNSARTRRIVAVHTGSGSRSGLRGRWLSLRVVTPLSAGRYKRRARADGVAERG